MIVAFMMIDASNVTEFSTRKWSRSVQVAISSRILHIAFLPNNCSVRRSTYDNESISRAQYLKNHDDSMF